MNRAFLLICAMSLCSMLSWGQTTWDLSETMTATLDSDGVLTISTTAEAEAMLDYTPPVEGNPPLWYEVRSTILSVIIEENVTTIGNCAFYECDNLIAATIPNSVELIGDLAFFVCMKLVSITIPNSATRIGSGAFDNCQQLASITIPKSVVDIWRGAFHACWNLKKVTVEWTTPLPFTLGDYIFVNPSAMTLIVPRGTIDSYQVTPVWQDFGTIEEVKTGAWQITETMSATLDEEGLFTVRTTATAEAMPDYEYWYTDLSNAPWADFCDDILSVNIEKNITTIGNYAFYRCENLASVTIPNSVETIGNSAFNWCHNLSSIIIPNSVTKIGERAIGSDKLESVTIPRSVTEIGECAFLNCWFLKEVTVEWSTPLTVSDDVFQGLYTTTGISYLITLRVPAGTRASYQTAPVWKGFKSIVEYDYTANSHIEPSTDLKAFASGGVLHVSGLQAGKAFSVYSLAGQLVYNGTAKAETEQITLNIRGNYIVTSGEQRVKVIVF